VLEADLARGDPVGREERRMRRRLDFVSASPEGMEPECGTANGSSDGKGAICGSVNPVDFVSQFVGGVIESMFDSNLVFVLVSFVSVFIFEFIFVSVKG
jgi:hypothetical protein